MRIALPAFAVALSVVAVAAVAAGDAPPYAVATNADAIRLMPELRTAPAPAFVTPGLRLTYAGGAATIPGAGIVLVPGPNGTLVNKATGQAFSIEENAGGGGLGLTQLDVVAVHRDAVAAEVTTFGVNNGDRGPVTVATESGATTTPGALGDYWIHPDVLARYADVQGPGVRTFKAPFRAAGVAFDALWRTVFGESSSSTHVYDLKTGLLLHAATCAANPPSAVVVNGVVQTAGGGTNLSQTTLAGVRQLKPPWAAGRVPRGLDGVRRLRYEGTVQVSIPLAGPVPPAALGVHLTVTGRGDDFLQLHRDGVQVIGNVPAAFASDHVTGPALLTPLAVAPADLANLREGQVLDTDPVTKVVTAVAFAGRSRLGDVVVITSAVPRAGQQRVDTVYDRGTGLAIGMAVSDPVLNQVTKLTLVGTD